MAVNGDNGGARSFLDLSGELRNAVYNDFIDLDPTVGEATALAHSSQQIRAEFGSLCLASGYFAIPTEHVESFLRVFFPHNCDSKLQEYPFRFDLSFDWLKSRNWLIGLLKLVEIMHQYSLLKISWFKDITTIISILKSMDARKMESMTYVEYAIRSCIIDRTNSFLPCLGAFLWVKVKNVSDLCELGLVREYGIITVRFSWEYDPHSEEHTLDSSSGDEDGSEGEEDSSDSGDNDEDGDEDAPDSSEGAKESSG